MHTKLQMDASVIGAARKLSFTEQRFNHAAWEECLVTHAASGPARCHSPRNTSPRAPLATCMARHVVYASTMPT